MRRRMETVIGWIKLFSKSMTAGEIVKGDWIMASLFNVPNSITTFQHMYNLSLTPFILRRTGLRRMEG